MRAGGTPGDVGISWGGQLGATYTSLFPGRTRALFLDSPIDGDLHLNRPLQARLEQRASFEQVLQRFLAWSDISEDELDARLDDDPDVVASAMYTQLSVERPYPHPLRPYLESAEDIFAVAPHFAAGSYEGAPPALVVHSTHDPATPYAWGKHVVRDLGNARLLAYRGDGHSIVTQLNPCVLEALVSYLNDVALPPTGATCDQAPLPSSSKKSSSIVRSSSAAAWTR
jgi:pimeloyl-ACP methyl ester carboxylesterase